MLLLSSAVSAAIHVVTTMPLHREKLGPPGRRARKGVGVETVPGQKYRLPRNYISSRCPAVFLFLSTDSSAKNLWVISFFPLSLGCCVFLSSLLFVFGASSPSFGPDPFLIPLFDRASYTL